MEITWLHISDFHIRSGDPYDRDVVLRALVKSVADFRKQKRFPDLIFATGDIAYSGKTDEYKLATKFFDDLLDAAGLKKNRLFIIPGNHDTDRNFGIGLARTLESREQSDAYFGPAVPKPHLSQKLGAFLQWHNEYLKGVRVMPEDSTCGPTEAVEIRGHKIGVLPINSAVFCQDDNDHDKLLIGRRCLDAALQKLHKLESYLNIALIHHPLDWLNSIERSNIVNDLRSNVDFILRGHLHETEIESIASASGQSLHCAAGAAYQTRKWPNRAMYATIKASQFAVFPIRYEDQPQEVWTLDPSLFPTEHEHGYEKSFAIPRLAKDVSSPLPAPIAPPTEPERLPKFRSNIPSRQNLRLVGRDTELHEIVRRLGPTSNSSVLVLHGTPGVGKSELAREFGRRYRERYPGGTFTLDASSGAPFLDLAGIGKNILGLDFPSDFSLHDQGQRTFYALQAVPTLLIYDNAPSLDSDSPWLPRTGMFCNVLITSVVENWGPGWDSFEIKPLPHAESLKLIAELAGREVTQQYGEELASLAGGLPVQLCPAAATLAYAQRRGHLESARLTLTSEAAESFSGVYESVERQARLLLLGAAFLNTRRIPRAELFHHFKNGLSWTESQFQKQVDACLDLHLLEGTADLRMHQLFAHFLLGVRLEPEDASAIGKVRQVQNERFVKLANEVAAHPNRADPAATLLLFPLSPEKWTIAASGISIGDGKKIGHALVELGHFEDALPWFRNAAEANATISPGGPINYESLSYSFHMVAHSLSNLGKYEEALPWCERAAEAAEKGDAEGRVDHDSLSRDLSQVGLCLFRMGKREQALQWYERAVEATQKGDIRGRVNHDGVGRCIHQVGYCLSSAGKYEEARPWFERAVEAKQKGDIHGRVDHDALGTSLHQVGVCLSDTKYEEARPWFERAVEAKQRGDIHGRVDHDTLGTSLHQVGYCLSTADKYDEARPWFERAVEAKQKGDIHGRVDHAALGKSLNQVGYCLSRTGKFEEAWPWFQRAAEAKAKGDIHGRVDKPSVAVSLGLGAQCLRSLGRESEAKDWEEKASKLES